MNFKLTEEQELIRKNIREFCVKNVEPIAAEIDEKESHPADLFKKLGEGGWMGIPIPTQYGGAGADYLTNAIVVEELSRSCSSTGFTVSIHVGIACMLINLFGTEDQKKKYLVPAGDGQAPGRLRPHRAGGRHGRHGRHDDGHEGRRCLRAQRHQDLHLQRPHRGHLPRLLLDRQGGGPQGHELLHHPQGDTRD